MRRKMKMKDREIVCQFYICEHECSKGREGTFRKACQHCTKYRPKRGTRPARVDKRRQKMDKMLKKGI